ncbi:MAG: hypothetical protein Q9194_002948, partial [Teloschistes cf. exilis]
EGEGDADHLGDGVAVFRVLAIDVDAEGVVGGGSGDAEPDPGCEEGEGEEDVAGEICAEGDAMEGVEGGEDVGGIPEDGEGELMLELGFEWEDSLKGIIQARDTDGRKEWQGTYSHQQRR